MTIHAPFPSIEVRPVLIPTRTGPAVGQSVKRFLPIVPAVVALILWWTGAHQVNLERTTDIGLVSVLPWQALLAPVVLSVGFSWCLARRTLSAPVLAFYAAALAVVLYGTTGIVEPVTGTKVVWRHAGIVDEISRSGGIDPNIDAYFNWPGFFVVSAFLTKVAGLNDVIGLARWAPLFFNLAFLVALHSLFSRLTADRRHVWLASWLFLITNWVAQDYFAPQAMTYLMYLVVLVLLFTYFGPVVTRRPATPEADADAAPAAAWKSMAAMVTIILLFAASVASHQLTPFALLSATTVLVLGRRCCARWLPVLMGVMIAAWAVFMTTGFLNGHLGQLLGGVGDVSGTASANVADRVGGSIGHLFVVGARAGLSVAVWTLALVGWRRRRRLGHDDRAVALLAIAPFPLLALQAYGGEMLMRVYLFGLPFMVFLAAGAILARPARRAHTARPGRALPVFVCLLLTAGFVVARYGNERFDYFTTADLETVQYLYEIAEPGSVLIAASNNLPWQSQSYADYRYRLVNNFRLEGQSAGEVAENVLATMLARHEAGAYFVLTRSQWAYQEATGELPEGSLEGIDAALRASPDIQLAYEAGGAAIFASIPTGPAPKENGS